MSTNLDKNCREIMEVIMSLAREIRCCSRYRDACMECGACSRNCPFDAISVKSGVGCAAAVIGAMLGRTDQPCCGPSDCGCSSPTAKKTTCCG